MATIKIKFRFSSKKEKEGSLYFQVIHHRTIRQVSTGHKLFPEEWDAKQSTIRLPPSGSSRFLYLFHLDKRLREEVAGLLGFIEKARQDEKHPFNMDAVLKEYRASLRVGGLRDFANELIRALKFSGRARTAETYRSAINSFLRFCTEPVNIPVAELDAELIMKYEGYLKSQGLSPNSISFYMRTLRAVYNQAIDKGLCVQRHPFKHVYTGIAKTVKRAIPLDVIRTLKTMDLTENPNMDFARDIFMFSFYTRGMSFIDMAYLRKSDLQNGMLIYRRHKTGQQLFVRWEKPMQDIIEKYDTADSPYLLPIIKANATNERRQYLNAAHLVNEKLKRIGIQLHLQAPLTTYCARHAWASIAKSKNVALSVISEAMGHDSEKTTRIYLASLDTTRVDQANKLILSSLV